MVKDLAVRRTTMRMVRDSGKAKDLEGPGKLEGRARKTSQDLCLGLERAGLLPHGLLVVSVVVVDPPIRGHMLTP